MLDELPELTGNLIFQCVLSRRTGMSIYFDSRCCSKQNWVPSNKEVSKPRCDVWPMREVTLPHPYQLGCFTCCGQTTNVHILVKFKVFFHQNLSTFMTKVPKLHTVIITGPYCIAFQNQGDELQLDDFERYLMKNSYNYVTYEFISAVKVAI
jgi:hypothetical protein